MRDLTANEVRESRTTALDRAEEFRLTHGQEAAFAVAIQQLWDGISSRLTQSWWVGLGGSWGEQVFGRNPATPSPAALAVARQVLEPVKAELGRLRQQQKAFNEAGRRALDMGIGTSPARPTRPCRADRRELAMH